MKFEVKKFVLIVIILWVGYINANEKCYGSCNKKYCKFKTICRPLNRTSKWSSTDVFFLEGVKLEAPIYLEMIANKKFRTEYRQHLLRLKGEMCSNLDPKTKHPFFQLIFNATATGNFLDPCPLRGHRYIKPQISTYEHLPLVPVGEWRLDFIITKTINNSEVVILSWFDFYEVKPTSAFEF